MNRSKNKLLLLLITFVIPLSISAQASGGQVQRKTSPTKRHNVISHSSTNRCSVIKISLINWNMVLDTDKIKLDNDREKALKLLMDLPNSSSYIEERAEIQKLLLMSPQIITEKELSGFRKVRSIQIDNYGIFSYDFFNCIFKMDRNTIYFEKITGSQRKSGHLYKKDDWSFIYLGAYHFIDTPKAKYGSERSESGTLYKLSDNMLLMVLYDSQRCELLQFAK